jgi:S-adenosylmethionine:tRNA ribosyltransferase-isomerase
VFDLSSYDYELPPELIATHACEPRDHSRLLVVHRNSGLVEHHRFFDLPRLVPADALFVANNSRVLPSRFVGTRILPDGTRGGRVEALLLEKKSKLRWEALLQAARKGRAGLQFEVDTPEGALRGCVVRDASESEIGSVEIEWERDPVSSGGGAMPLPPYIDRDAQVSDQTRYQTVYSKELGSSAAPTAGLHFTPELIARLQEGGAQWEEITLHVGVGTFRPIKVEDVRQHRMHEEFFSVSEQTAARGTSHKRAGKKLVAVGTTSVRTLETAWDKAEKRLVPGSARTQAFLYPGGPGFECVDALITNFHLPKSSLLLLVSAFAGVELVRHAYQEAIREKYRFFSYGDAMLIL